MIQPLIREPASSRALLDRPFHEWSRSDIALVKAAVRGNWNIHQEDRARIVASLRLIVQHPERCGYRKTLAAAKVLLEADRINLEGAAPRGRG